MYIILSNSVHLKDLQLVTPQHTDNKSHRWHPDLGFKHQCHFGVCCCFKLEFLGEVVDPRVG